MRTLPNLRPAYAWCAIRYYFGELLLVDSLCIKLGEHSLGPNTKYEISTLPIISHISLILYFVCLFFCLFVYLSVSCKDCASSALPIISHLAPLLAPLSESGGAFLVAAPVPW